MNKILDVVEDIKQNITDKQYKTIMESLVEMNIINNNGIPPHTPRPPDLLVESLSNVELKRSQMTSIWIFKFQHAPFRKGWLLKINYCFSSKLLDNRRMGLMD